MFWSQFCFLHNHPAFGAKLGEVENSFICVYVLFSKQLLSPRCSFFLTMPAIFGFTKITFNARKMLLLICAQIYSAVDWITDVGSVPGLDQTPCTRIRPYAISFNPSPQDQAQCRLPGALHRWGYATHTVSGALHHPHSLLGAPCCLL